MKFTLKNIGLIKNSEIKLDGLTVITGHNNSGKTTVGKALYACIEGTSDIDNRFEKYKLDFLKQLVATFKRIYKEIVRNIDSIDESRVYNEEYSALYNFSLKIKYLFPDNSDFTSDCVTLNNEIDNFISENQHNTYIKDFISQLQRHKKLLNEEIIDNLNKLNKLDSSDILKDIIDKILQKEFANQIQPVKNKSDDLISELNIKDSNNMDIINLIIADNAIINDKSTCRFFEYNKAFLIDNPFILDELRDFSYSKKDYDYKINLDYKNLYKLSFLNNIKYMLPDNIINYKLNVLDDLYIDPAYNKSYTHNYKLKIALSSDEFSKNVIEKIIDNYSDNIEKITKLLNSTIPGEVIAKQQEPGFEYIHKDYKLNLSNLATGTKLFAIMKILIDKGIIDNNTILILDEPESHLHPEWQNKFAELLVLLVKDVDCRILLTTHSPNFLLAIEAFMYKHNIVNKCNFYKTQFTEDNEYVDYVLSNNTNEIYGDFVKFLSQVKEIRNTYANLKGDIDNEH